VKALERGTERLASGDLGYQIDVQSDDEIGDLATSFNEMSRQLHSEHDENVAWTHTLEQRVEQKTHELKRAHEHALHTEKMATIGKMAAVLAHEINNPLSGILTYAKLLRKWIDREEAARGVATGDDAGRARHKEICDSLDLIASESRRCGDLVKNLLTFSRTTPMNLQATNLNQVVDRSLRLVQHQLDLAGIQVQTQLDPDLPPVVCDAAQMEQVILALVMNALDAMRRAAIYGSRPVSRMNPTRCAPWCAMTAPAFQPKSCRVSLSPFSQRKKRDAASGWGWPSATAF